MIRLVLVLLILMAYAPSPSQRAWTNVEPPTAVASSSLMVGPNAGLTMVGNYEMCIGYNSCASVYGKDCVVDITDWSVMWKVTADSAHWALRNTIPGQIEHCPYSSRREEVISVLLQIAHPNINVKT